MHPFWDSVLRKKCSYISKINNVIKNNNANTKVAIIIEPRKYPWLEAVIRNVMYYLGSSWNLEVVTFDHNKSWIQSVFPGCTFRISTIPFENINQNIYNAMLLHSYFWQRIPEQHVLIFQSDCIMFRNGIDAYLDYDYVGANYFNPRHTSPLTGGIQGGFSLRNRGVMLECLQKVDWNDINKYRNKYGLDPIDIEHEDIFFTHACEILKKKTLEIDQRKRFSIEAEFFDIPIAHHGTTKSYFSIEQMQTIISRCEDREAWS